MHHYHSTSTPEKQALEKDFVEAMPTKNIDHIANILYLLLRNTTTAELFTFLDTTYSQSPNDYLQVLVTVCYTNNNGFQQQLLAHLLQQPTLLRNIIKAAQLNVSNSDLSYLLLILAIFNDIQTLRTQVTAQHTSSPHSVPLFSEETTNDYFDDLWDLLQQTVAQSLENVRALAGTQQHVLSHEQKREQEQEQEQKQVRALTTETYPLLNTLAQYVRDSVLLTKSGREHITAIVTSYLQQHPDAWKLCDRRVGLPLAQALWNTNLEMAKLLWREIYSSPDKLPFLLEYPENSNSSHFAKVLEPVNLLFRTSHIDLIREISHAVLALEQCDVAMQQKWLFQATDNISHNSNRLFTPNIWLFDILHAQLHTPLLVNHEPVAKYLDDVRDKIQEILGIPLEEQIDNQHILAPLWALMFMMPSCEEMQWLNYIITQLNKTASHYLSNSDMMVSSDAKRKQEQSQDETQREIAARNVKTQLIYAYAFALKYTRVSNKPLVQSITAMFDQVPDFIFTTMQLANNRINIPLLRDLVVMMILESPLTLHEFQITKEERCNRPATESNTPALALYTAIEEILEAEFKLISSHVITNINHKEFANNVVNLLLAWHTEPTSIRMKLLRLPLLFLLNMTNIVVERVINFEVLTSSDTPHDSAEKQKFCLYNQFNQILLNIILENLDLVSPIKLTNNNKQALYYLYRIHILLQQIQQSTMPSMLKSVYGIESIWAAVTPLNDYFVRQPLVETFIYIYECISMADRPLLEAALLADIHQRSSQLEITSIQTLVDQLCAKNVASIELEEKREHQRSIQASVRASISGVIAQYFKERLPLCVDSSDITCCTSTFARLPATLKVTILQQHIAWFKTLKKNKRKGKNNSRVNSTLQRLTSLLPALVADFAPKKLPSSLPNPIIEIIQQLNKIVENTSNTADINNINNLLQQLAHQLSQNANLFTDSLLPMQPSHARAIAAPQTQMTLGNSMTQPKSAAVKFIRAINTDDEPLSKSFFDNFAQQLYRLDQPNQDTLDTVTFTHEFSKLNQDLVLNFHLRFSQLFPAFDQQQLCAPIWLWIAICTKFHSNLPYYSDSVEIEVRNGLFMLLRILEQRYFKASLPPQTILSQIKANHHNNASSSEADSKIAESQQVQQCSPIIHSQFIFIYTHLIAYGLMPKQHLGKVMLHYSHSPQHILALFSTALLIKNREFFDAMLVYYVENMSGLLMICKEAISNNFNTVLSTILARFVETQPNATYKFLEMAYKKQRWIAASLLTCSSLSPHSAAQPKMQNGEHKNIHASHLDVNVPALSTELLPPPREDDSDQSIDKVVITHLKRYLLKKFLIQQRQLEQQRQNNNASKTMSAEMNECLSLLRSCCNAISDFTSLPLSVLLIMLDHVIAEGNKNTQSADISKIDIQNYYLSINQLLTNIIGHFSAESDTSHQSLLIFKYLYFLKPRLADLQQRLNHALCSRQINLTGLINPSFLLESYLDSLSSGSFTHWYVALQFNNTDDDSRSLDNEHRSLANALLNKIKQQTHGLSLDNIDLLVGSMAIATVSAARPHSEQEEKQQSQHSISAAAVSVTAIVVDWFSKIFLTSTLSERVTIPVVTIFKKLPLAAKIAIIKGYTETLNENKFIKSKIIKNSKPLIANFITEIFNSYTDDILHFEMIETIQWLAHSRLCHAIYNGGYKDLLQNFAINHSNGVWSVTGARSSLITFQNIFDIDIRQFGIQLQFAMIDASSSDTSSVCQLSIIGIKNNGKLWGQATPELKESLADNKTETRDKTDKQEANDNTTHRKSSVDNPKHLIPAAEAKRVSPKAIPPTHTTVLPKHKIAAPSLKRKKGKTHTKARSHRPNTQRPKKQRSDSLTLPLPSTPPQGSIWPLGYDRHGKRMVSVVTAPPKPSNNCDTLPEAATQTEQKSQREQTCLTAVAAPAQPEPPTNSGAHHHHCTTTTEHVPPASAPNTTSMIIMQLQPTACSSDVTLLHSIDDQKNPHAQPSESAENDSSATAAQFPTDVGVIASYFLKNLSPFITNQQRDIHQAIHTHRNPRHGA